VKYLNFIPYFIAKNHESSINRAFEACCEEKEQDTIYSGGYKK